MFLSYVLLFSYLLCYVVFLPAVVLIIIYAHGFFCTSCFPLYTHTHYGRVLTTLGLHVQLLDGCSNVQVFDETVCLARSLGPLPLILVYLHFILVVIL